MPTRTAELDPLPQLVYPQGRYHLDPQPSGSPAGSAHTLDVTFVPKLAYDLQHKYGPKKANRSSTTRAEFIRSLVNEMGGRLYCKQLDVKQPIGVGQASSATIFKRRPTTTRRRPTGSARTPRA